MATKRLVTVKRYDRLFTEPPHKPVLLEPRGHTFVKKDSIRPKFSGITVFSARGEVGNNACV